MENPGLLPAEVLLKIFSYCSYQDRVKFQFVCRWWQQVSRDKRLWKHIVYKPDWSDSTQEIIDNLKASPELRALDLRDVELGTVTKELVAEIVYGCPQLEQLSVSWLRLFNAFNFKMNKIKKIFIIECYNRVSFEFLHYYFPNVEHLDCGSSRIDASDLVDYLRKKESPLHNAGFSCLTCYSGCILPYLSVCANLKSITLYHPCGQAHYLPSQSVQHLKQIFSLTLVEPGFANVKDYLSMFMYFPNLTVLELHKCSLRNQQALPVIAENCPLLEELTFCSPTRFFGDQNLKYVSNFKKLTFLCLRSNPYITDACVAHLQAIQELRFLDISDCIRLTPQCLLALCNFDKLETLKFDLRDRDLPASLGATPAKNRDLHIMFYRCKDASVLDRLRSQRFRVTLLKWFTCESECANAIEIHHTVP